MVNRPFVILLSLFITFCVGFNAGAQVKRVIEVKDKSTNEPISYYSLTDGKNWVVGDSLGRASIPSEFLNKKLNLKCLSYPDTIISILESEFLKKIALRADLNLDEVVIKPSYVISQNVQTIKNSIKKFNSIVYTYNSAVNKYPIEYGTIYDFDKMIKLKSVSFRASTNYPDGKVPAIIHIYSIDGDNEPVALEVNKLNKIVPVTKNDYFIYDLVNKNMYLNPGKYLISFELMPTNVPGEKISISFNFSNSSPSKMATSKGKKKWIDARTGDFMQLISTIEYHTVLKFN